MCGICGWISQDENLIDIGVLKKMTSVLRHRGPDDSNHWRHRNAALGHTRLSIIDLDTGSQPMLDGKGMAIVFNGEIYNYREIRQRLISKGITFKTKSDTEVVLEAYKYWGEDSAKHLDGMFAYAIVDTAKHRVFLARDRFGKKPLHYLHYGGHFIFASEIKSILQHKFVQSLVDVDDRALIDYLSIGYTLSPKTIFTHIKKLPPASWTYLDWKTGTIRTKLYWKLEDYYHLPKFSQGQSVEKEVFLERFSKAVESRLHADVPIGAFLSSGLDSTSVVAMTRSFLNTPLRAFSIGFDADSYDESHSIRKIAKSLDTDLEINFFKPVNKNDVSQMVWHFDEPFADNSAQPMYQLNRFASRFGKVALSGDGADELFAGYPTYRADRFYKAYRRVPQICQRVLLNGAKSLIRPSYRKVSLDYKLRQFLGSSGLSPERAHYWWRVIFPSTEIHNIVRQEVLDGIDNYDPFNTFADYFSKVRELEFFDQTLYVDSKTWLLDDILVKVDRMSMAHSVEVRCPFLDHHLAEYAAQLSMNSKMTMFSNKKIVRQSMDQLIPTSAKISKKQGFNAPPNQDMECTLPLDERFHRNYALSKIQEDVTFKMNNLVNLTVWFDMYANYKKTGIWAPIECYE